MVTPATVTTLVASLCDGAYQELNTVEESLVRQWLSTDKLREVLLDTELQLIDFRPATF